jgi:hypothetical protein
MIRISKLSVKENYTVYNRFIHFFGGVPHLATYILLNFQIEPELGAGINPDMAFTQSPSSILDETRFEPIIFRS